MQLKPVGPLREMPQNTPKINQMNISAMPFCSYTNSKTYHSLFSILGNLYGLTSTFQKWLHKFTNFYIYTILFCMIVHMMQYIVCLVKLRKHAYPSILTRIREKNYALKPMYYTKWETNVHLTTILSNKNVGRIDDNSSTYIQV